LGKGEERLSPELCNEADWTANDLSGRDWLRTDDRYVEEPREDLVSEIRFSEFNPEFRGTYFEHVHSELSRRFPIGRTRILSKGLYNCNSWHRDREPRLHIPIETNPGSLFVVNHHVTPWHPHSAKACNANLHHAALSLAIPEMA
jgi:hypothetical protein